MFFRIDQYFYLIIIKAENVTLYKYLVQDSRNTFRVISEIVEKCSNS